MMGINDVSGIAWQRADKKGLPLAECISSEEDMRNDFMQAEDDLVRSLQNQQLYFDALAIRTIDPSGRVKEAHHACKNSSTTP